MVDGLERSDAQRIAALEARVAELERGNPTCVCGAYTPSLTQPNTPKPKRERFPLPWRKEAVAQFPNHWNIFAANNQIVTTLFNECDIDRILSLTSRLEAAEKCVALFRKLVNCQPIDTHEGVSALSAYDKSTLAPVDG